MKKKLQIAVIGSAGKADYKGRGGSTQSMENAAEQIGNLLAKEGAVVITGGKDGVMEAAGRGAKRAGGTTIGVVKGSKRRTSNQYTDIEVVSGMEASGLDELLIILMSDALIVVGGGAGTLQEIALAYRNDKSIIVLEGSGGWGAVVANKYLDGRKRLKIQTAKNAADAVEKALRYVK